MLNGGQTEHCRASGCVIINGRGWNTDDKRKNGNCATVGVYFQSMLLCFSVFVCVSCTWCVLGLVVGVKVRVCICGCVLFGGQSRWLNGGKPANTVTLIGWRVGGEKRGEQEGDKWINQNWPNDQKQKDCYNISWVTEYPLTSVSLSHVFIFASFPVISLLYYNVR